MCIYLLARFNFFHFCASNLSFRWAHCLSVFLFCAFNLSLCWAHCAFQIFFAHPICHFADHTVHFSFSFLSIQFIFSLLFVSVFRFSAFLCAFSIYSACFFQCFSVQYWYIQLIAFSCTVFSIFFYACVFIFTYLEIKPWKYIFVLSWCVTVTISYLF